MSRMTTVCHPIAYGVDTYYENHQAGAASSTHLTSLLNSWRVTSIVIALPTLAVLPLCAFVSESPRFLFKQMKASSGNSFYDAHAKQYVNVMTRIAKWNRVELPTALLPGGGLRNFEKVRNCCCSSSGSNSSSNTGSNSGSSSTSSRSCGSGIANKHGAIVPAFQPQRQEQEQQQQQEQEPEPEPEQAENARQPDVRDLFSSTHVHSTPVWLLTMGGR